MCERDVIGRTERRGCPDRRKLRHRWVGGGAVTGFYRAKHRLHVAPDRDAEICQAGRRNPVARQRRVVDQRFQCELVEARIPAFARHIEARTFRVAGATCSGLQNTQAKFYPVVGS